MSWAYTNEPEKDVVHVKSWQKLSGFAQYLYHEMHPSGAMSEYHYLIPAELLKKAKQLGGELVPDDDLNERGRI